MYKVRPNINYWVYTVYITIYIYITSIIEWRGCQIWCMKNDGADGAGFYIVQYTGYIIYIYIQDI